MAWLVACCEKYENCIEKIAFENICKTSALFSQHGHVKDVSLCPLSFDAIVMGGGYWCLVLLSVNDKFILLVVVVTYVSLPNTKFW